MSVERTLLSEAVELPTPAFAAQTLPEGLAALDRLSWPIAKAWPTADASWRVDSQRSVRFEREESSDAPFELGRPARAAVRLLAFYVDATAFVNVQAEIETAHRARVWLDGVVQLEKKASDTEDADPSPGLEKSEWALDPGFHRVVVEALFDPDQTAPWDLRLGFEVPAEAGFEVVLSPRHRLGLTELLDAETVRWMGVSSDGKILAVGMGTPQPPSDHSHSWIDFYDTGSGRVLRSLEGLGTLSSFEWDPREGSYRYAFVARRDEKSTLWVSSFEGGSNHPVLADEEHFGSFWWLPDGSGLLFSRSEEGPKDPENFKRYRGLTDRWEGHRSHSFLYRVDLESSVVERLTDGELSTSLQDIHRSSKRLLFTRTIENDSQWPFSSDELYELDLVSLDTTRICEVDNGLSAKYTDDDQRLLVVTNPMAFGGVGLDVPEGTTANLYDGQAFLFDREASNATAISRDFDPAIGSVQVLPDQDRIYARVTDLSFDSIYSYDLDRGQWEEIPTEVESVQRFAVSRDGSTLVYQGTSSSVPSRIYTMRLRGRPRSELLVVQDAANVTQVNYGAVEDYDVVVETGEIKGRVYYPPDFDPSRKYPAIVYY